MTRSRKLHLAIILAISALLALDLALVRPQSARAVIFSNESSIPADVVINDDLFISSTEVTIDGVINGDLFVNAEKVTINGAVNGNLLLSVGLAQVNGPIDGSLLFAGQAMRLKSNVSGSVYAAGAAVIVEQGVSINRNLFFWGYSLETAPDSYIGRDVNASSYQTILKGEIAQDVMSEGDALEITGKIGRNIQASVKAPDEPDPAMEILLQTPILQWPERPAQRKPGLRIAETAEIGGALSYSSTADQSTGIQSQPLGGITFQKIIKEKKEKDSSVRPYEIFNLWLAQSVQSFLTLFILGALVSWLFPRWINRFSEQARRAPWHSTGWGFLALIIGFSLIVAAAILLVTVGIIIGIASLGGLSRVIFGLGFPILGMFSALFIFALEFGSKLTIAHLIGKLILSRLSPCYAESVPWSMLLGIVIYVPLSCIPLLGWIISLFATLLGLGAIWLVIRTLRLPQPAA